MSQSNVSRRPRSLRPASLPKPPKLPQADAANDRLAREVLHEIKLIRRSVVPNSGVPTHEEAFMKVLEKLLERYWPRDERDQPRPPNEVAPDQLDMFQARIDDIAVELEPWFGLRSWFLQRGDVWQTMLDRRLIPLYAGTFADVGAAALREVEHDPSLEKDVLNRLVAETYKRKQP